MSKVNRTPSPIISIYCDPRVWQPWVFHSHFRSRLIQRVLPLRDTSQSCDISLRRWHDGISKKMSARSSFLEAMMQTQCENLRLSWLLAQPPWIPQKSREQKSKSDFLLMLGCASGPKNLKKPTGSGRGGTSVGCDSCPTAVPD